MDSCSEFHLRRYLAYQREKIISYRTAHGMGESEAIRRTDWDAEQEDTNRRANAALRA